MNRHATLRELSTDAGIPKLIRDVVDGGGRGIRNGGGFYSCSSDEAERWGHRFREFNYKMRRLSAEYSDLLGEASCEPKQQI